MRGGGPVSDRPPVVELLHTREVGAGDDHGLDALLVAARDDEGERRGKAAPTEERDSTCGSATGGKVKSCVCPRR